MNKKLLGLICALGFFGGIASAFVLTSDTTNLVVTNATYYGTEGDIHHKFKGWMGSYTDIVYFAVPASGYHAVALSNYVQLVTNTFGSITNDYWTPGTSSNNSYYVSADFSCYVYPGTNDAWYAEWMFGVVDQGVGSTNFIRGDGGYFTTINAQLGAANHILKIKGDDQVGCFLWLGSVTTGIYKNVDVDIMVVAEDQ
jgi:hypothetical protein